jgi:hypothetical protein
MIDSWLIRFYQTTTQVLLPVFYRTSGALTRGIIMTVCTSLNIFDRPCSYSSEDSIFSAIDRDTDLALFEIHKDESSVIRQMCGIQAVVPDRTRTNCLMGA